MVGRSSTSTNLYLNFFLNRTLQSHGKTLRQLTSSSSTLNALLAYIKATWISITEEWHEVQKIKIDVVQKLSTFLYEDPEDKPTWWNKECKQDSEGALLCLLMTGVSEHGVIKWFTEKFVTVVVALMNVVDGSKMSRNGKRESLMVMMLLERLFMNM